MTRVHLVPLLLLLSASAVPSVARAQTHKVDSPDKIVRAVAVYEWTGDLKKPTASRLVPVSLYINGQFQDAGVYLARPVPFALDTGFSYELDEAGVPRGLFDTIAASNLGLSAAGFDDPWIGTGDFTPSAPPPRVAALRTIKNPAILSSKPLDDGKPHLVNKSPDAKSTTSPPASTTAKNIPAPDPATVGTGAKPSASTTGSSSKDEENDVDRPTLRRQPPPTREQQKAAEAARKKAGQASVSAPEIPLNDDPDRPHLHYHSSDAAPTGPATLLGLPADMHQLTAVSDAVSRPEHNFTRSWQDAAEHTTILNQLRAMARTQLAAYEKLNPLPTGTDTSSLTHAGTVSTATPTAIVSPDTGAPRIERGIPKSQAGSTTAATPGAPSSSQSGVAGSAAKVGSSTKAATAKPLTPAARRRAAAAAKAAKNAPPAAPAPQPLLDEQLHAYELSYGADATFVYTAHTPGSGAGERFVTLVAQLDPFTQQLQLAIHSVTDAAHRDRTPQMVPVDAVDADASNRASLLMDLRNQSSRQFALYRVMRGHADQIFLTGTTP